MEWEIPYVVSRSLTLEVSRLGKLVGATSLSRRPSELDPDALPVLLGFSQGATPRAAFDRLSQEWEMEEAGFVEFVQTMIDQGFLVPVAAAGAEVGDRPLPTDMFGSVFSHLSMLRDTLRVMSYRAAIERHSPGKTVVEVGCGTGILSLFAAKAGARKVTAIEETRIAEVAAAMFAANGCAEIIDLKIGNSRDVEIDEPADLLIHEILGVDAFDENILPVILDARRRFLRPGGRLLPQRVEICCVGVETEETPGQDPLLVMARARELSGFYGMNFDPFLAALDARLARPQAGRVMNSVGDRQVFERKILSEEVRLMDVDLQEGDLEIVGRPAAATLRIVAEGKLGGVALFFRAHLDEELRITNSPLAPITSWGWDVRTFSRRIHVSPGDEVTLSLEIESTFGRQRTTIDLA
jgi:protein arginine N-methyltransferase 1